MSRLWQSFGQEGIVAHARQVKLISQSSRTSDQLDAHTRARGARVDSEMLRPIRRRSAVAPLDLIQIRVQAERL